MIRTKTPDVFPIRGLIATAMCVVALGVLIAGNPSLAAVHGSVPDFLRRAQSGADAHRFEQLLGAIEGKIDLSESAHTDNAVPAATVPVKKLESNVEATPPAEPAPVVAPRLPPKPILQTVAPTSNAHELKRDDLKIRVVAKKAMKIGLPRSRGRIVSEVRKRLHRYGVL